MKISKKIISSILILTLSLGGEVAVLAQNDTLTEAEKACENLTPDYYSDEEIGKIIEEAEEVNYEVYEAVFERAQIIYHGYVSCLFEYVENTVYKSNKVRQGSIVAANTPNTDVIDWMVPTQACLDEIELKEIIDSTNPEQMLGPLLKAHSDYKKYLNELGESYSNLVFNVGGNQTRRAGGEDLYTRTSNVERINREREMEIDASQAALDLMLTSQKELRTAFVMHVHFQCTLKALEKYRIALEDLRTLVEPLPDLLRNASITKG